MEITEGTIVTFRKPWVENFQEQYAKATGEESQLHEGMVGIVEKVTTFTKFPSFRSQARRNLSTSEALAARKETTLYRVIWENQTNPNETFTNTLPATAIKVVR